MEIDLFEYSKVKRLAKESPLAARMRPETIEDVIGQEHILSEGKLLYRAIKADKLGSLILYGPPGSGKTSLAKVIASTTKAKFYQLNASNSGKKDITKVIELAKDNFAMTMKKSILFIDEIHRFNKIQQDALLPYVEDGTIILIGATTENPYFEVNKSLVSRSRVFQLNPLSREIIKKLLFKAIEQDSVLSMMDITIDDDAIDFISDVANGDVRTALNALELGVITSQDEDNQVHITLEIAEECIQKRAFRYDKDADEHHDTISAYILSIKGSDPDAALYYLMRMLHSGEDPKYIARRLIVSASFDIGMADSKALEIATAVSQAVEYVGMPECRFALAHGTVYLALAPKSDSITKAIARVEEDVKNKQIKSIPPPIKDFLYLSAHKLGNGVGFKNPHDYENHIVKQQYLPDELIGKMYYEPTKQGDELALLEAYYIMKSETK